MLKLGNCHEKHWYVRLTLIWLTLMKWYALKSIGNNKKGSCSALILLVLLQDNCGKLLKVSKTSKHRSKKTRYFLKAKEASMRSLSRKPHNFLGVLTQHQKSNNIIWVLWLLADFLYELPWKLGQKFMHV